jgi:signal transduction histidine kinase/ActR/RegA family two-component response regulator
MSTDHNRSETGPELRVLLLPGTRADGAAIERVFRGADIVGIVCRTMGDLCRHMDDGFAAAVVAQEAIQDDLDGCFGTALSKQPDWSDVPIIVLTPANGDVHPEVVELASRRNVVLVQRPAQLATFLSTVKAAIRDRRRQYRVRDYLEEERQHSAALAEADRRKDEFLAILAHELRNPLAPLRTGIDCLLVDAPESGKGDQDILPLMSRQVNHMVRLIDDLLDVSRISRGQLSLRRKRVELSTIVQSAVETARIHIEGSHHRLQVSLPATPVWLDADADRLAQVFSNLLNNSAKYMEPGGSIHLLAEVQSQRAFVRVRDTGVGIPPDMLTNVFGMFTQVGSSLERSRGGLGIGLTLVKSLVDMHGGSIVATSAGLGHGSEFCVELPVCDNHQSERLISSGAVYRGRPLRVLIADDNIDGAFLLAGLLKRLGQTTEVVHNGLRAIEAISRLPPDVAILDIGMPGLNGYEVADRIRRHPQSKGLYLAALTGWGSDADRRKAIAAGFDTHLVKPVVMAVLVNLLETVAGRDRVADSASNIRTSADRTD